MKHTAHNAGYLLSGKAQMIMWFTSQLKILSLSGLAAVLLVGLAFAQAWPLMINIGQRDERFVQGFHEAEQANGAQIRWTTGESELHIPQLPTGASIVHMRIMNSYPAGQADPIFTLRSGERHLGSFPIPRTIVGMRHFALLVPGEQRASWATSVAINSTTFTPPGDPRPLGAMLDWVRITPTTQASVVAPLFILIAAFALGAGTTLFALLIGVRPFLALSIALLVVAAIALLAFLLPLDILPFIPRIASIPIIGCLAIWFAQALGIVQRSSNTIEGTQLPLLFAIAWWSLPVFQAVQILDGAFLGVGIETYILAGIALLALAFCLAIGYSRLRGVSVEQRRAQMPHYALGGAALGAFIHLWYALWYAFTRSGKDFWILFKGARDWVQTGALYDLQAVVTNHVGAVLKVPPFYAMLFVPFVFQDGLQILFFHRMLNVVLMLVTVVVWLRMFRSQPLWWGIAVATIVLNSRPLADTIAYGQIDLMLVFLLTCALWAMRNDRDGLAGALIALGALFKVYPIILLAFFVLKGRWRGVVGFALGMLVYNGVAIAIMGWETHRIYLFEVIPRIGGTTSWVENQTISGFMARFADVPFEAHVFGNRTISLVATAISGLLSLLACWLTLRPSQGRSTLFALQYTQYLLLMVLAVPAAWMHYETLLVFVYLIVLMHLREQQISLGKATLLALSFALINYGNQWSFNGTTIMGVLTIVGISYKFYGMLLLWFVLLGELRGSWLEAKVPTRIGLTQSQARTAQPG